MKNSLKLLPAACFVVIVFLGSMMCGRYPIGLEDILTFLSVDHSVVRFQEPAVNVLYHIRLPRILLALLVGASLSMSGTLFQGMFRNPLVSPDILGVTSGCCFGAALGILHPGTSPLLIQLLAFSFGILAVILTYTIASLSRGQRVVMLVLAGSVISAFFFAALSFLKYIADPYEQLPAIVFWIMGGFHRASWDMVRTLLFLLVPCMVFLILTSWRLNVLSLGDEEATSLGVNVKLLRPVLIIVATLMTSCCVSVSGTVSWVGLVIPHIARLTAGVNHDTSMPMSMLLGSGFILLVDDLARTMTASEIPISILTSAIGAPFFAYLLIKEGQKSAWR